MNGYANSTSLPYTGMDVALVLVIAVMVVLAGLLLRYTSRRRSG